MDRSKHEPAALTSGTYNALSLRDETDAVFRAQNTERETRAPRRAEKERPGRMPE